MANPRATIRSAPSPPHSSRRAAFLTGLALTRSKYRFGRTLGAGTYGVVREADSPGGKVAVKIILKRNVKGNEQMVYDELEMLQKLKHPHIVKFVDWFESRVSTSAVQCQHSADGPLGQVLHCYSARYRRRALRPNLRAREIHREGCRRDH